MDLSYINMCTSLLMPYTPVPMQRGNLLLVNISLPLEWLLNAWCTYKICIRSLNSKSFTNYDYVLYHVHVAGSIEQFTVGTCTCTPPYNVIQASSYLKLYKFSPIKPILHKEHKIGINEDQLCNIITNVHVQLQKFYHIRYPQRDAVCVPSA